MSATRSPSRLTRLVALTGVGLLVAGALLLPAGSADAHVRVIPDNPTSGSFSALTFRVPNESEIAGTIKVSVQLPQDTPFLYVSTKPVSGWSVKAVTETLPAPIDHDGTTITKAVRTVTWTADDGIQIGPGQYQEFSLSVGPLPDPGTIELPAIQTYSDGSVVSWNEPTPASGEEPEHPAPAFAVAPATEATDDHHGAAATPSAQAGHQDQTGAAASDGASADDPTARALGGLGLAAGLAALAVALVAVRRRPGSGS